MEYTYDVHSQLASSHPHSRNVSPSSRKRKQLTGSPLPSPSKATFSDVARPVVSSKRARLSAQHPLARPAAASRSASSASVLTLTPKLPLLGGKSQLFPSPPLASVGRSFSDEHRACVSCKRVATSTLQLAKFKRCEGCGRTSCPICARQCGGHGCGMEEDPAVNGGKTCGRTVCRECSSESPHGIPICHECSFSGSSSQDSSANQNQADVTQAHAISFEDYDFSAVAMAR